MSTDNRFASDPRVARVLEIKHELELRNALYVEFDALVVALAADGFQSTTIGDEVVNLKDAFAGGKNTGWTSAAVKRFDIEVISPALAAKRAKRAGGTT